MSTNLKNWYENQDRIFPGHFHAASLMELLLQRGFNSHQVLKRTKLFYDDVLTGRSLITAEQFLQIIENGKGLYNHPELSFLWGHGLFPGHYDGFSQLIQNAPSLDELLEIFCQYPQLTPFMTLHRWEDEHTLYLEWRDAIGVGKNESFLIEAYSVGITSLINWYFSSKLPWRFGFSTSKPIHIEEYEVNFGSHVQFDLGMNFIMLDKAWLNKSIPDNNKKGSSKSAWAIAKKQCDLEHRHMPPGFIDQILSIHRDALPNIVALSEMADMLDISPATLKRKLARHNFNFQRSQDLMRLSVSLRMMQQQGLKISELADYLEITDVNNFRRAFKRWCGMTPAAFKERLV